MGIEPDRLRSTGHEDLLLALGERNDGDAREVVRRVDRLERGRQLAFAAVDHDEVWDRREALVVPLGRRRIPEPRESAGHDLRHRGEVVLPLETPHGERPVVRSARLCVDEHRHRGDDVASLDVRDVEALDPGRKALEVE